MFVKRFLLLFSIGLILLVAFIYNKHHSPVEQAKKLNEEYLKEFNYSFSGIVANYVENRESRGEHFGIITLVVKESDIDYYNPKDTTDIYFCTINRSFAKVLIPVQYELEKKRNSEKYNSIVPGDSLVYDGQEDKFILYYDSDSYSWNPLWLSNNSSYRQRLASYLE